MSAKTEGRPYQSYSSLSLFMRCPRLYRYRYVEGYRETDSQVELEYGTAWHGAMACLNSGGTVSQAFTAAQETGVTLGKQWWAQISAALPVYAETYSHQLKTYKPILVEKEQTVVFEGVTFKAVFDAIVEDSDGILALLEHKTTSSKDLTPEGMYWQRRAIDHQTTFYLWAARQLGYDVQYIIYDVTRRCLHRQTKNENYADFNTRVSSYIRANAGEVFVRREFEPSVPDTELALSDLMAYARMIGAGAFPRSPNNCTDYGRSCTFLPVCTGEVPLTQLQGVRKTK